MQRLHLRVLLLLVVILGCTSRRVPLLLEFKEASAREFEVENNDALCMDCDDDPRPAYYFIRQHGHAALPAYRQVVRESRYAAPRDGARFTALKAALFGLMEYGDRSDEVLLQQVATDLNVELYAVVPVLYELIRRHPERRSVLLGPRLLYQGTGGSPELKLAVVESLAEQLDPEARKWLRKALEHEPAPEVRRAIEEVLAR